MHIGKWAAWGLRLLLFIGLIWSFFQGRWDNVGILLASLVTSIVVGWLEQRFFGSMGVYLDLLFALLIVFNNFFGLVLDFYHTVPEWDIVTHYTTSIFLAVSALVLMQRGYPQVLNQAPKLGVIFAVLIFSLGLGGLWEIGEFASDFLRHTDFQMGLINTMQDLIVDSIAGIIVGTSWVLRRKE